MTDNPNFGFGKFVPGFDFLQNLAKGATQSIPQLPNLANWVAPTLNVEELDKRITELKAVQFWLEQNSKALGATIQALEVQKMTLATLKGMNFSMAEVANALKLKPVDFGAAAAKAATPAAAAATPEPPPVAEPAEEAAAEPKKAAGRAAKSKGNGHDAAPGIVDPLQWWGSLTQQFQEIASTAMKDVAQKTAMDAARNMAAGVAKETMKAATGMAKAAAGAAVPAAAKKAPAKKKPAAARKAKAA
jgi:hypothetical protein